MKNVKRVFSLLLSEYVLPFLLLCFLLNEKMKKCKMKIRLVFSCFLPLQRFKMTKNKNFDVTPTKKKNETRKKYKDSTIINN
jgi:hypothetical protein